MKKFLSILLTLCFCVNISFAFDPYADEEVEKKSYKKLYYGIALTLLGGFLAYDGFSLEKVDVSKPSVDYTSVSHSEWVQISSTYTENNQKQTHYELRSGISLNNVTGTIGDYTLYEILCEDDPEKNQIYAVEPNVLYNNGNVALRDITIEVRYMYTPETNEKIYIGPEGYEMDKNGRYYDEKEKCYKVAENQGYHIAQVTKEYLESDPSNIPVDPQDERIKTYTYETGIEKLKNLDIGESITWQDIWEYTTISTNEPNEKQRSPYLGDSKNSENNDQQDKTGTTGLHLGKQSAVLMDVRVILKKHQQYTPIYQTRHKSDLEGVAGIFVGIAGIYFIIDHFLDMHKFNAYVKRHHLNLRVATASNEYKLMLQKRI